MHVLVLNAGSSSLKSSLIETPGDTTLAEASATWSPEEGAAAAREETVAALVQKISEASTEPVGAVGYRVVHGGALFRAPHLIDQGVLAQIQALDELAPLHNRIVAETIQVARELLPGMAHVACFDTSFHSTLDETGWRYPIPSDWQARWGIRRFGFHGLSVQWATERAATMLDRGIADLNLLVAHLGSGSSVTAVAAGRSVDTSMGFTPLEGLMMGTRAGSIDPGILLHLLRHGVETDELSGGLEHRSGLLAVSERTSDVIALEEMATEGGAKARLALTIYARRAAAGIAAAATTLDSVDALVFTGGIGEHSVFIRGAICERLGTLGVEPPDAGTDTDAIISRGDARVAVLRVTAREDVVIARETERLVARAEAARA